MEAEQGQSDTAAVFPFVLVDDDQWLIVCESALDLQLAVEPDFLYDIVAGFDARARPLRLRAQQDTVVAEVVGGPQPGKLRSHTDEYFTVWTREAAPEFQSEAQNYVASVAASVKSAKTRRKKLK